MGPGSVSVWLIPTTDGLILIDTAQEPLVDHVIDSIRKVGFDPKNIKYILLSHGHLDHFGGAFKIQQLSGARVATLEEDWQLIEKAAGAPGRGNAPPPAAPKRDMVIKEGDTVTLGKTAIKVYKLPGHTAGSPSYEFTVYDNGRPHRAFVFGGPGSATAWRAARSFWPASVVSSVSSPTWRCRCTSTAGSRPIRGPVAAPCSSPHRNSRSAKPASRTRFWPTPRGASG